MSSPFRSSNRSTSTPRASPSRQHLGDALRDRPNGHHRSYREDSQSSPSAQLLDEFSRLLVNDEKAFTKTLDIQSAEQEKLHREALHRSLAEHEAVRQSAERARERVELEIERARRQREDAEKRALEEERRKLAEAQAVEKRRQLDELQRKEAEQEHVAALEREKAETERRIEAQMKLEAENEAKRRATQEKNDAETKARAEAAAKEREQQAQKPHPPGPVPNGNTTPSIKAFPDSPQQSSSIANQPNGLTTSAQERQEVHDRYMALHQRLKEMRKYVQAECNKDRAMKGQLGDWRRALRTYIGQQTKGVRNKDSMDLTLKTLTAASRIAEPSVDISQFIITRLNPSPTSPPTSNSGSGILLYLLSYLAKYVIQQFIAESDSDTATADAIAVFYVSIMARPEFQFNSQPLIDVFWAKYHRVCPPLFGIWGSERSRQGRDRLGWWRADKSDDFVPRQEHYNRMTGLAAGFASVTMRDFSKSRNRNPAPNRIFWEALARLVNTPRDEVTATHYVLLKSMLENSVPRLIGFYGQAGVAALRKALIDFPKIGPRDAEGRLDPVVVAVETMPMTLQRDLHLTL